MNLPLSAQSYQSNHTGIETRWRWAKPHRLPTINRTTLELKPERVPWRGFAASTYQSNHTGIETRDRLPNGFSLLAINRTTLELKHMLKCLFESKYYPINRTTLELKRSSFSNTSRACFLSIEPHWNWNWNFQLSLIQSANYQSNHTGIETEAEIPYQSCQQYLSIEPHWNWN